MREINDVDSELRLIAAVRRAVSQDGGPLPSIDAFNKLLDERTALLAHATRRRA